MTPRLPTRSIAAGFTTSSSASRLPCLQASFQYSASMSRRFIAMSKKESPAAVARSGDSIHVQTNDGHRATIRAPFMTAPSSSVSGTRRLEVSRGDACRHQRHRSGDPARAG